MFNETCGDRNLADSDGCLDDCTGERNGWHCVRGDIGNPSVCSTRCGDGYIIAPEVCEHGNTLNSDGCSSTCTIEDGWEANGSGGVKEICGDEFKVG